MPITATLAIVASAAMAGVPLLNGFLSKEMFFTETVAKDATGAMDWILPAGATLAAIFSVAYSTRFIHDVFFNGAPVGLPKIPHEPPHFMRVPVEILVVLCIAVGLAPALTIGPVLAVGAQAALFGGPYSPLPAYTLAIWHGFNLPLAMSVIALAGGLALYFALQRTVNLHRLVQLPLWIASGGREVFLRFTDILVRVARAVTATIQNGSLQRYLMLLVLLALAAGAAPYLEAGFGRAPALIPTTPLNTVVVAVFATGVAATIATVAAYRQRLIALLLLGAVGLVVSLAFAYLSAPDLALTQLLVEMVTIILMMLALHWLPAESAPEQSSLRKLRDAVLATAAGLGIAALNYALLTRPFDSISPYFLETAVNEGGGANAVNVIIVDYRGYDTLGEITVLGIAGIVIYALLANFTPPAVAREHAPDAGRSLFLALTARLLLPMAVLVAIYLYLRGHNAPGGGFIAGLVLALGLILQYVAHGHAWMAARLRGDFRGLVAWGLLVAGATGVASAFFGAPFLTSTYAYLTPPLLGAISLASAALFDLGVFLTVVGATLVALVAIGKLGNAGGAST
jgi:multicomponent K+:H+ antiporter subunit A